MSHLRLENLPEMRLAALPHRGPYHQIGATFAALAQGLGATNAIGKTKGLVGVYYDNPFVTPEEKLRSHAGAIWVGGPHLPQGTEEVVIPAGRYAVYTLVGPYEGLASAWAELSPEALSALGAQPRDAPALEIYRNNPIDTSPEDLRTDLCLAVD